jgi:hypothetical protein
MAGSPYLLSGSSLAPALRDGLIYAPHGILTHGLRIFRPYHAAFPIILIGNQNAEYECEPESLGCCD